MPLPEPTPNPAPDIRASPVDMIGNLLAAGNTDDLIAWDKLPDRLKNMLPGLPDSERAVLLLALANGDHLNMQQISQMSGGGISISSKARATDRIKVPAAPRHMEGIRQALGFLLDKHRTKQQKYELTKLTAAVASRNNVIIPSWSDGRRSNQIISRNIGGGLAYALWLIMDEFGEYRDALCRCDFTQCRRFFFRRRPGRGAGAPIRKFCSADHAKKGDDEKARNRMRNKRRRARS